MSRASQIVSDFSLSFVPSFLKGEKDALPLFLKRLYSVLTFEPLHKFRVGILELLENCYMGLVESEEL